MRHGLRDAAARAERRFGGTYLLEKDAQGHMAGDELHDNAGSAAWETGEEVREATAGELGADAGHSLRMG